MIYINNPLFNKYFCLQQLISQKSFTCFFFIFFIWSRFKTVRVAIHSIWLLIDFTLLCAEPMIVIQVVMTLRLFKTFKKGERKNYLQIGTSVSIIRRFTSTVFRIFIGMKVVWCEKKPFVIYFSLRLLYKTPTVNIHQRYNKLQESCIYNQFSADYTCIWDLQRFLAFYTSVKNRMYCDQYD